MKDKHNDIGFIINDTTKNNIASQNINYIFAKRKINMITNVLSIDYIFNNKIDLSIKLRYHLDQVKNIEFKTLGDDGYLFDNQYYGYHNINYTVWTSDIAINWWFSPGSQASLVWKNGVENQTDQLINHWQDNIHESFSIPQQNSLSIKVIYYLDYLYLIK